MPPVQPNMQANVHAEASMQRAEATLKAKANKKSNFIKTVVIVMLSLVALTFIGLFIWVLIEYNNISDDVNGKITLAVAAAVAEQEEKDVKKFAEAEKKPYLEFAGPADYGGLSFEYPRTWSVYVEKDARNGGEFKAYLNPIQVDPISNENINALRVTIRTESFESVVDEYQRIIDWGYSNLSVETITVGGVVANKYSGTIPNSELNGYIIIFKIRDKAAILQTDSVLFEEDFNRLLETVHFNA